MASEEQKQEVGERYFLPRSLEEAQRMQNQHEWIKGGAGGLVLAPIDLKAPNLRILDAATADGYWIKDAKEVFSKDAKFLGFDSDPDQYPPLNPPVEISKQNLIEDFPAEWNNQFDFVHQRFVIPLFAEPEVQPVLHRLTGCVKPGGWIQLVEMDFKTPVSVPLDSCPSALKFHDITSSIVSDPLAATKLPDRLRQEGFVDVDYKMVDMIAGAGNPDPELGARGKRNMASVMGYFRSVTTAEKMGMTEEEWGALPKKFEEEMDSHKVAVRVYFVWGKKP